MTERAEIVAWLLKDAREWREAGEPEVAWAISKAARQIERGEHKETNDGE